MVVDESPAHPGVAGQRGDREWFTGFQGGVPSGDPRAGLARGVEPAEGDEPVGVLGRGVLSHGQPGRLRPVRWGGGTLAGVGGPRRPVRSYVPVGVVGRGVLRHGQPWRLRAVRWWGRTLAGVGGPRRLVRSYVPCEGRTPC